MLSGVGNHAVGLCAGSSLQKTVTRRNALVLDAPWRAHLPKLFFWWVVLLVGLTDAPALAMHASDPQYQAGVCDAGAYIRPQSV